MMLAPSVITGRICLRGPPLVPGGLRGQTAAPIETTEPGGLCFSRYTTRHLRCIVTLWIRHPG